MATDLEQYFKWQAISLVVFGIILFTWTSVPQIKKILGFNGLIAALIASTLVIYYFKAKSGYNPFWYLANNAPK